MLKAAGHSLYIILCCIEKAYFHLSEQQYSVLLFRFSSTLAFMQQFSISNFPSAFGSGGISC